MDILTDEQIVSRAEVICRPGDEPEKKSEALFVLMHEIAEGGHPRGGDIASIVERVAFGKCGDGVMNAQAELLRSKILAA